MNAARSPIFRSSMRLSLVAVLLSLSIRRGTSNKSLGIASRLPKLSETRASSSSKTKEIDWKLWRKFQSGNKTEPSAGTKEVKPQRTHRRTWGDARKPSEKASDVVERNLKEGKDKKNRTTAKAQKERKDNPKLDRGGDDIVYGPSKPRNKRTGKGNAQEALKENLQEAQKEKEVKHVEPEQVQRSAAHKRKISAYAKKKSLLEQKRKGREQKTDKVDEENDAKVPDEQNSSADVKDDSRESRAFQTNETTVDNKPGDAEPPKRTTYVVMGGHPHGPTPHYRSGPPSPRQPQAMPPNQALALAAAVSLTSAFAKLWVILWVTRRLSAEHELLRPAQHFVWECLNDRYARDEEIFSKVLATPAVGFSRLKWSKYLRSRCDKSLKLPKAQVPTRTVIVVDIMPNGQLDIGFLKDVMTFLIGLQSRNLLGKDPEVVLLLRSGGGEVTTYGLAAAQVARLEPTSIRVTVSVDSLAASGGYMIACQSSQILAAPFAMVGSVGVIREGLNYNKLLLDHGIKPMILKAGEMKNPLSSLGPVTDRDIEAETARLEETHRAFVDWCLSRRPILDRSVCNGVVQIGKHAIDSGMVDRVLTSDEYIMEKICSGDHVLKLHKSTRDSDRTRIFARALDLLPHLKHQLARLQGEVPLNRLAQGYAVFKLLKGVFRLQCD